MNKKTDNTKFAPVCMAEEFWANSQFSLARYTGRVRINGHVYVIVNKDGKDIFECSIEAEKAGREKAIEPGEPADLCRQDFVRYYRKFGRETFIKVLEENMGATDMQLTKIYEDKIKEDGR